ncbi:MAG: Hsp20/alpha crystallin family protein, partial [Sulfuricella sp.]|nr:Hsp20/alpha crystallin family protein [Sulfuricella sp.]
EKEGEKVLRSERYYGKVYRSFTLGQNVDDAAATAKYSEGVLDLTLPKKATTSAKKLAIQ